MKKETKVKTTKTDLPLKSHLLLEQAELSNKTQELVKEMQEREYIIDFKNTTVLNSFVRFLEKKAPWGHTTATGLVMLYTNLKQEKAQIKHDKKWDGKLLLRSANVNIMWSMVTKMSGAGFYEAKAFIELMANVGESLSAAVQQSNVDTQELRMVHAALNDLDTRLADPTQFVDDVPATDEEAVKTLKEEVDPTVMNA